MNWKQFLKPTKLKLILTFLLLIISEILLYWYGADNTWFVCITSPCPSPNYGPAFVLYSFIPLLLVYYLFLCVIFSIKEIYIASGRWKWINLLSFAPLVHTYIRTTGSGCHQYYIGIPYYIEINCCRNPCNFRFLYNYESFFLINIILIIFIFTLINIILFWIFKNKYNNLRK